MARFYARFDSGSAGWNATFDGFTANNAFKRAYIAQGSASAALLRGGLIASRSAVSAAVKADIATTYHNGALGTYFPPDSGPFSTDSATFVSWSNVYTSSVDGIIVPADYRTRPTASVLSTMTSLVGEVTPIDSMSISWGLYTSASQAVLTTLQSIVTGSGAGGAATPYTRPGNYPARTLHGIWHDVDLQYFAWDDFTPGQPVDVSVIADNNPTTASSAANYTVYWETGSVSFPSDYADDALALVELFIEGGDTNIATESLAVANTGGSTGHTFNIAGGPYLGGPTPGAKTVSASVTFRDTTITASFGLQSAFGGVSMTYT